MTPPPAWLTEPEARACFYRVQSRLIAMGEWQHEYVLGLPCVAAACADYLQFMNALRECKNIRLAEAKAIEKRIENLRLLAREGLANFLMIPFERVPFSVMNAEGLDTDIADLCAPLNKPTSSA